MGDFFAFRRMVTIDIVRGLFVFGFGALIVAGLFTIANGQPIPGLLIMVLGPLALRIVCELFVVAFAIHEALIDLRRTLLALPAAPGSMAPAAALPIAPSLPEAAPPAGPDERTAALPATSPRPSDGDELRDAPAR